MFGLTGFTAFISCIIILSVQQGYGSEIIGGNAVKPHSMPFMALLGNTKPKCGGTLIHQSWVLTAAHCNESDTVSLGVHSIKSMEKERRSRQVRKVKKYFPHPEYDQKTHLHDLMLLKLDKPVKKTKTVNWLQLNKTVQYPKAGTICVVAGWGTTKYNVKAMSDVLMSVRVPVIDRKNCNSRKHYNGKPPITDNMVCAGTDQADTCQGDSGGPLLVNGALLGITSFGGKVCGTSERPGVYTFLTAEHLGWISNVMKF